MSFGRRLYDILRASVGHYTRGAGSRFGAGSDPDPEAGWEEARAADESERGRRSQSGGQDELARAYRLLELRYGSGPEEVRSAHRSLMRRYHPDRFARDEAGLRDATRLSQEITAARDLLLSALRQGAIR